MPLLSVQTKLSTVLTLAQQARACASYYSGRFAPGQPPVQAQELVNLAKQYREIATAAAPFVGDTAVSAEADRQFAGQAWQAGSLLVLLNAVLPMVEAAIAAVKAAVPGPVVLAWNENGTTSPAVVDASAASSLLTVLAQISATIPE